MNGRELAKRVSGLHQNIVNDVPSLKRGMVWCTTCNREQSIDPAQCLQSGWPKCCGYTMTIDSPEERGRSCT